MSYSGAQKEEFQLDEALSRFRQILDETRKETNLTDQQMIELLEQVAVPVSVMQNRKLGILESVVKYLHEELNHSLSKIAHELNRDARTIWSTYNQAKNKHPARLIADRKYMIPVNIFANRRLGVLEALVVYLRDSGLRYSQIGSLLARDQRTIWTAYKRAKSK